MRKHPIVEFIKYLVLIAILVSTMNPVVVGVLLLVSFVLTRGRLWVIDLWVFSAVVVIDLFSSIDGVTFLAYHNYHIITYEALIYGIISGLRLAGIINISWKFSQDVKSDKLVIVTSYLAPPLSLLISMTIRNINRYSKKIKEIYFTQLSMEETSGIIVRFIVALRTLSIMIDWALDNGMETIFSMDSRGYGKHRRTSYHPVSLTLRDIIEVTILLTTLVLFVITQPKVNIIPEISIGFSWTNTVITAAIAVYGIVEECLESKCKRGII